LWGQFPSDCLQAKASGLVMGRQVVQFMKTRKKKQSSFTTRQGVLLLLVLGTFFFIVFFLAYYVQAKLGWSLQ